MLSSSLLALGAFATAHVAHGLTLPPSRMRRDSSNPFDFQNSQNQTVQDIYVATVNVGGKDFEVQLDTGSSDLWFDTTGVDLSSFTNTSIFTSIPYG